MCMEWSAAKGWFRECYQSCGLHSCIAISSQLGRFVLSRSVASLLHYMNHTVLCHLSFYLILHSAHIIFALKWFRMAAHFFNHHFASVLFDL